MKLNRITEAGTAADSDLQPFVTTSTDIEANPMLPAVLSKNEAISLMKQGKKVTHRYFSNDEWITMFGNIIRMEMGQECWASEFWRDRQGEAWETDWSLYGG